METDSLSEHDIIIIGVSTGALGAVPRLIHHLPPNLGAAILITAPAAPHVPHLLTAILNKVSALPAVQAAEGEPIEQGHIYVAPPDHHLEVREGRIHLDHGPREKGHRPAIDALFRSAAAAFGSRVVGLLLSGSLEDGLAGLNAVKQHGGVSILQDPAEALVSQMPENALYEAVDYVLPLSEIGPLLVQLTEKDESLLCSRS
jgi:two-component system chemotaxis response regulator CheB